RTPWTRSVQATSRRPPPRWPGSRTRWRRCRKRCRVQPRPRGGRQEGGHDDHAAQLRAGTLGRGTGHARDVGESRDRGAAGAQRGSVRALRDGDAVQLGRTARYAGIHLWVPRDGVAVHINAFNFPAWGTAEKTAASLLAGMPIISKPATSTALVASRLAELGVETGALPPGSFSFLAGSPGDLLDRLGPQDVVAFTGSSQTAARLREQLARRGARLNVEADSLNAAVLGPDAQPGSATWDVFVQDVVRDMTQKAGQKCTAVRRIFVGGDQLASAQEALVERLGQVRVGDPARPEVSMGPVSSADQLRDVRAGIAKLASESQPVFGGDGSVKALAPEGKGYFVSPVLLLSRDPVGAKVMHKDEVFG